MSLSDLTFSSPRKALSDKSNDEDFEKFLNDSSFSDISFKNKKNKKSNDPWWMKDDNDSKHFSASVSKSFIKKPKPKLTTPLEVDETNDLTNITQAQTPFGNRQSTFLSKDSLDDYIKSRTDDHFKEIKLSLPEQSLDSTITSTDHKNEDDDEEVDDEYHSSARRQRNSSRLDTDRKRASDEQFSAALSTDRRSLYEVKPSNNDKHHEELKYNETMSETKGEHLLSKVIFMDSLENTMNATALNDSRFKPKGINNLTGKKQLKVQISEDRIEHEIEGDDGDEESPKSPSNIKTTSDTQTRNDLEELQEFYRKNLQQNTANLNTLTTQHVDEMIKTMFGASKNEATLSRGGDEDQVDSIFGLQAIHIRKELEEQTLNEVLKEFNKLERSQRSRTVKVDEGEKLRKLNNVKYKHVKSSGYGRPNWSPVRLQSPPNKGSKNFNETLQSSKTYLSMEIDSADGRESKELKRSRSQDHLELIRRINNLTEERENDKILLKQLKDEFVAREKDYAKTTELLKSENDRMLLELRQQIEFLQTKLSQEGRQESVRPQQDKTTEELENLIKNYQLENERLYNEVKKQNEKIKSQKQEFETELQKLQIDLINKNLQIDNYKQLEKFKSLQSEVRQEPKKQEKVAPEQTVVVRCKEVPNERVVGLEAENKQLKDRLKFFEINQRFIEDDVAVIDSKNKEIKRLSDKIKLLENGKNVPEYMRKLKEAQIHVKELEQIVKRLRHKPVTPGAPPEAVDAVLAKIEYYEKRVDVLEKNTNEKSKDYERLNRMWTQKYEILKGIMEENSKEFSLNDRNIGQFDRLNEALNAKLNELDKNYQLNVVKLEFEKSELKKQLSEVEAESSKRVSEGVNAKKNLESELEGQWNDFKMLLNKYENAMVLQQQQEAHKKEYEPKVFKENPIMNDFSHENAKMILDENVRVKQKYAELEQEFNKRIEEFDFTLLQIKEANTIQINALREQYKHELEKFLQGIFGMQGSYNINDDNLLNQIRLKFIDMKHAIDEKDLVIRALNEKYSSYELVKEKCANLENLNMNLNERLNELSKELSLARLYHSPEMKHYEALSNKMKVIENRYKKREKELNDLMTTRQTPDFEYEANHANVTQLQHQVKDYQILLEKKDTELLKFRFELDSMLELLNSLQMMVR